MPDSLRADQYVNYDARTQWAYGASYYIKPWEINATYGGVLLNQDDITFSLSPMPRGLLMDTSTGEVSGHPSELSTATSNNISQMLALISGASVVIVEMTFEVLPQDTEDPGNGPGGRDCENGFRVDEVEFNAAFTCSCGKIFEGPNCENMVSSPAATSAADADTSSAIGSLVAGLVVLVLIGVTLLRYKMYRLKHSPVDVKALQDELLQSMGIALATNIGNHELGITLCFDSLDGLDQLGQESVLWEAFTAATYDSIGKCVPQLVNSLRRGARMSFAADSQTETPKILVILPRPSRAKVCRKSPRCLLSGTILAKCVLNVALSLFFKVVFR